MKRDYIPIIGLEIHVELGTKSKMFCGCSADFFGQEPNTLTCPVCLGLPGALPVPNRKAVEWTIMLGLALNCKVATESKFDRKNYFYPDLPKGYQISQYDHPLARNGQLALKAQGSRLKDNKIIKIRRVHLEEDTGKLIHENVDGGEMTLIDFNRSGVPLVEIVTEPDIESSKEAVFFLKKLRQIIRYLGISDADMEKGSMRIEPNVSVLKRKAKSEKRKVTTQSTKVKDRKLMQQENYRLPDYKVEIKNINSFKFAKNAIDYEIQRQIQLLDDSRQPLQETRGWDEKKQKTVSQRIKEEAHDYRYFPEPDIPPMRFSKNYSNKLKKQIPELPDDKTDRFTKEYKLSLYDAEILTVEKELADWFEEAVSAYVQTAHPGIRAKSKIKTKVSAYAKPIANWIIGLMGGLMRKESLSIKKVAILPAYLAELLYLLDQDRISQTIAKKVFVESFKTGKHPVKIVEEQSLGKMKDSAELKVVVERVLKEHKEAVKDYNKGKKEAIGFLIGQVMQKTQGKVNAQDARDLIRKELDND